MNQNIKRNLLEIIPAILGIFLYAVSYRIIIVPLHLFGGGFTGIAQTILAILNDFTGITLSSAFKYSFVLCCQKYSQSGFFD